MTDDTASDYTVTDGVGTAADYTVPELTEDTTTQSYWINWRVLLCFVWLLISLVIAWILIAKYEGPGNSERETKETEKDSPGVGVVYADDAWRPSLRSIHPGWLLAYRLIVFVVLLFIIIQNLEDYGYSMLSFYTQWTFTLLTVYFGLGTMMSIYGCSRHQNKVGDDRVENYRSDVEHCGQVASMHPEITNTSSTAKSSFLNEEHALRIAGFWGYIFQIIFQVLGGAVILTDCVFWFIIFPFEKTDKDKPLLAITMHSINAGVLIGETMLGSSSFPWFRSAYFFLWTILYVVLQWGTRVFIFDDWPYEFLDLSDDLAPVWYLGVALIHIPCYAVFVLITKIRNFLLSKLFPLTYQCR